MQLELVLNSSSSSDITVNMFSIDDSASGEHYNINSSCIGSNNILCIHNIMLLLFNELLYCKRHE